MATTTRTRGEYRKSTRRREEILDAAFEVFSRSGYLNASMTEIARGAGFTLPGLSHHFPTKAALFEAVVQRRDIEAQERLEGRHGIDLLRNLVLIAERDELDVTATRLYAIIAAEATEPEHPMNAYFRRRYDLVIDNIARALREARDAGILRPGLDPTAAAEEYVALSDGLQLQALYGRRGEAQSVKLRRAIEGMLTVPLG